MASKFLREYKIVIFGDDGVGKSSLLARFTGNHFPNEYDPVQCDLYRKQMAVDDEMALLDVCDTAGQDEYSALREQHMRVGEGFLLAYSITSKESLHHLKALYQQIVHFKEKRAVAVILVGCKSDLEAQRQVSKEEAQKFADELKCKYHETSSLAGIYVDLVFEAITREIRRVQKGQQAGKLSNGKPHEPTKSKDSVKQR